MKQEKEKWDYFKNLKINLTPFPADKNYLVSL